MTTKIMSSGLREKDNLTAAVFWHAHFGFHITYEPESKIFSMDLCAPS